MSDCRVPMPVYSKDLIKTEEDNEIPPIPEGWMAINLNKSMLTMERDHLKDRILIEGPPYTLNVVNKGIVEKFSPVLVLDVLVLVKEHS